jgi:phage terminase large subunit GpA-like protein
MAKDEVKSVKQIKVKPFNPHKGQRAFLRHYFKHPEVSTWTIKASRQSGKSFCMLGLMFDKCINTPNTNVLFITPTFRLAKNLVTQKIIPFKKNMPFVDKINLSDNTVYFKNYSTIQFVTGNDPNNLRGLTLDYCVIDEAAYQDEILVEEIVPPMLTFKGKGLFS